MFKDLNKSLLSLRDALSHAPFVMLAILSKVIKFSFIAGSKLACFSLSQAISPLAGKIGGNKTLASLIALKTIILSLTYKISLLLSSTYFIPTAFGSLYITSQNRLLKAFIPTLCIFLFVIHPIGSQSWVYSLYWLLPISLAFMPERSFFLKALGATFTQHAVGSVIWLYTRAIPAPVWNGLISVVWAERLLFALAMTATYYAYIYVSDFAKDSSSSKSISNIKKLALSC